MNDPLKDRILGRDQTVAARLGLDGFYTRLSIRKTRSFSQWSRRANAVITSEGLLPALRGAEASHTWDGRQRDLRPAKLGFSRGVVAHVEMRRGEAFVVLHFGIEATVENAANRQGTFNGVGG